MYSFKWKLRQNADDHTPRIEQYTTYVISRVQSAPRRRWQEGDDRRRRNRGRDEAKREGVNENHEKRDRYSVTATAAFRKSRRAND